MLSVPRLTHAFIQRMNNLEYGMVIMILYTWYTSLLRGSRYLFRLKWSLKYFVIRLMVDLSLAKVRTLGPLRLLTYQVSDWA